MTLPVKPEVCIIGTRVAVFMGADYKFLELATADKLIAAMQGKAAELRRQLKHDNGNDKG
ncbi:hypothetical protein [Rhodanobacter caeni]